MLKVIISGFAKTNNWYLCWAFIITPFQSVM